MEITLPARLMPDHHTNQLFKLKVRTNQYGSSLQFSDIEMTMKFRLVMEITPLKLPTVDHHTSQPFSLKVRMSQSGHSPPFSDIEMTMKFNLLTETTPPRLPMVDHHISQPSKSITNLIPLIQNPKMRLMHKLPLTKSSKSTQSITPGSLLRMVQLMVSMRELSLQISPLTPTTFS